MPIHALGFLIPPDDADLSVDQKYRAAVYALNQRPASLSSPCLVCGEGHRFDDCPVLKNIEYLKDHYIKFCSFLKRALTSRLSLTRSLPPFVPTAASPSTAAVNAVATTSPPHGGHAYQRDQDFHWRQA